MKNSNERTEDEIIALNDSMEQASWRVESGTLDLWDFFFGPQDRPEDDQLYDGDYEYDDSEDDDAAFTSAGMGTDEDYGYVGDQGFYEYED